MKFQPQPISVLQLQYRQLIDDNDVVVMSEYDGRPSTHAGTAAGGGKLPWLHVFDFPNGLVLCLSLERTPYIALPEHQVELDPGQTYLHASASWAEGYRQPGPDVRDFDPDEITDEVIHASMTAAFEVIRHAVAALRMSKPRPGAASKAQSIEEASAEYIDDDGFPHALFAHPAAHLIHRAEA